MARIGVRHAVFATGSYTDGQAPTYTNGKSAGKAVEINVTINHNDARLDADDHPVLTDNSISGIEIAPTVADMTPADKAALFGYNTVTNGGYVYGEGVGPYGGYGYVETGVDESTGSRYYQGSWYFKVSFAEDSLNAKTKGESVEFATLPMKGKAMAIQDDNTLEYHWGEVSKRFTTVAEAIAWVDGKAGISSSNSSQTTGG